MSIVRVVSTARTSDVFKSYACELHVLQVRDAILTSAISDFFFPLIMAASHWAFGRLPWRLVDVFATIVVQTARILSTANPTSMRIVILFCLSLNVRIVAIIGSPCRFPRLVLAANASNVERGATYCAVDLRVAHVVMMREAKLTWRRVSAQFYASHADEGPQADGQ